MSLWNKISACIVLSSFACLNASLRSRLRRHQSASIPEQHCQTRAICLVGSSLGLLPLPWTQGSEIQAPQPCCQANTNEPCYFITRTRSREGWGGHREMGAVVGGTQPSTAFTSSLPAALQDAHAPSTHLRLSGVLSIFPFLCLVTHYFTACFMRCSVTSAAKYCHLQQLSVRVWSVGFSCPGQAVSQGYRLYFPFFKVLCGLKVSQRWCPQEGKQWGNYLCSGLMSKSWSSSFIFSQ